MIYLTLATGNDLWERVGNFEDYRSEGTNWWMARRHDDDEHFFVVLKPEVADWCFDNIGPYRIVEHVPVEGKFGPEQGDSWRVEFKTNTDRTFFKMRWG